MTEWGPPNHRKDRDWDGPLAWMDTGSWASPSCRGLFSSGLVSAGLSPKLHNMGRRCHLGTFGQKVSVDMVGGGC